MTLGARVRAGIALHVVVNVAFAGAALAGAGERPLERPPPATVAPSVESAAVELRLLPASTTSTSAPAAGRRGSSPSVVSTGYCLDGVTASGEPAGPGHVAMEGVALGTRVRLLEGPLAGAVLVVTDRIGSGTELDVWFDECAAAVAYGRRRIAIELLDR